ncbi:MAG: hypothetical protein N4A36_02090 [Candidatus Gracilibacteria bacterium]|jgi:hypothetical protein|nr:hypothetical protein [Candidatus Gracilibacteria bacterium]
MQKDPIDKIIPYAVLLTGFVMITIAVYSILELIIHNYVFHIGGSYGQYRFSRDIALMIVGIPLFIWGYLSVKK